jgi:uncharacterized peroxidase-related enzyme
MSRLTQIAPDTATGKTKELLDAVKSKLGLVPNMVRAMANSPAALNAYVQFSGALAGGSLSARNREQIALAVGQVNECHYCLSAHSALGKMAGLTPDQIRDSRQGTAADAKTDALLHFARKLVETRGQVSDGDVDAVRQAGFSDGEIAEAVAGVALNIFTNYFNHVAATDIDFPMADALPATRS